MLTKVKTSIIAGLDAVPVDVEVKIQYRDKPRFTIVGLADSAMKEARERVVTSIISSGFNVPPQILVNLAPGELRKEGTSLDLAIAAAILIASKQAENKNDVFIHGELSLDGTVKPIRGILAHVITALDRQASGIILPYDNLAEAKLVPNSTLLSITTLKDLPALLAGELEPENTTSVLPEQERSQALREPIFSDVWGQASAKRALLIAAAGGHNLLMQGPPGCGKSLLARKFPLLLPPLSDQEKLEVVKIHSIAGRSVHNILKGTRPLCSPHQGVSQAGLIGGGSATPAPGDISLAHNGVLFLDELPEYRKSVLESLRGPLENGLVEIRRARYRTTFPARFQLIAAMNSCPCGRLGASGTSCHCSQISISAYQHKVSGPIRDRIDLHVTLKGVNPEDLLRAHSQHDEAEDAKLKETVASVRALQLQRSGNLNAALNRIELEKCLNLSQSAQQILEKSFQRLAISARSYVRILRVARTIADLDQSAATNENHLAESLSFRELSVSSSSR